MAPKTIYCPACGMLCRQLVGFIGGEASVKCPKDHGWFIHVDLELDRVISFQCEGTPAHSLPDLPWDSTR